MSGPGALRWGLLVALAAGTVVSAAPGGDRWLEQLFPEADRFTAQDVLLTDEMAQRLSQLAHAKVPERLVTFYEATRVGVVLGYAVLHTHRVRTKNETLAVAFEPDGRLKQLQVVVFLEPPEYQPPPRWLAQLEGKTTGDRLMVGDDLLPISGATLSARGIAEQTRWLLQAFKAAVAR